MGKLNSQKSLTKYRFNDTRKGDVYAYGRRFEDIASNGLTVSKIMSMYILHEADESKFVEEAEKIINGNKANEKAKLHKIRKARGFAQKELSDASGGSKCWYR